MASVVVGRLIRGAVVETEPKPGNFVSRTEA